MASRAASAAYADSSCTTIVTEYAAPWMDEKIHVSEIEFYSTRLLAIASQVGALSDETRARLARTSRIIACIEQTPAADLTRQAILHVA